MISYVMLKHLPDVINILHGLFKIWSEGVISSGWKCAVTLPFVKRGKDVLIVTDK
jgi:hypothetical protein